MTAETQGAEGQLGVADLLHRAHVRIAIQGVDYSYVEVPLTENAAETKAWLDRGIGAAAYVARKLVPEPVRDAPEGPSGRAQRPQQGQPVSQTAPRRSAGGRGTGYYCPDHNAEVLKTAPQYDKDGDRYYHSLDRADWYRLDDGRQVKNHNLYLRQLVDREGQAIEVSGDIDPDDLPF